MGQFRRGLHVFAAGVLLAAAPTAHAQNAGRLWRVGYLSPLSAAADVAHIEAFRQGLRELGYAEGKNLSIETRYAEGRFQKLPELAADLVQRKVDVIVGAPTSAVRAARDATQTIPIVMAFSGDPVGDGLVTELARPGGNVTGLSAVVAEMAAKRVELFRSIVSNPSRVAFLANAATVPQAVSGTEAGGRALGVQVITMLVHNHNELDAALATLKQSHVDGVVVDLTLQDRWKQILEVALRSRLPTVSGPREFAEAGGLIAYGPHFPDLFRRAAVYVDRILKGAKPGQLPVEQPAKYELVINMKTAKMLGVKVSQELLLRADQVIE